MWLLWTQKNHPDLKGKRHPDLKEDPREHMPWLSTNSDYYAAFVRLGH